MMYQKHKEMKKALLLIFDYQMLRFVECRLLEKGGSVLNLTRGEFRVMKSESSLSEVWSAGSRYFGIGASLPVCVTYTFDIVSNLSKKVKLRGMFEGVQERTKSISFCLLKMA